MATAPVRPSLSWLFSTPVVGLETGVAVEVTTVADAAPQFSSFSLHLGPVSLAGT